MNKTSTITVDTITKEKAQSKAKKFRLPLSTIVQILLNDFAEGKIAIGVQTVNRIDENGFNQKEQDDILEAIEGSKNKNNLSNSFGSAKEMLTDLKSRKKWK